MFNYEYTFGPKQIFVWYRLQKPEIPKIIITNVNKTFALWTITLIVSIYLAFIERELWLIILLLVIFSIKLIDRLTYTKNYWRAIERELLKTPTKSVKLKVDNNGLLENDAGVESFAPWHSIERFFMNQDILFIELKSSLWAIISKQTLSSSSSSLDDLIIIMRENGVIETFNY